MGNPTQRTSLAELAALFFRLGATAFGGPAAHVALMQDEVVRRRGWMTEEHFLDLLSAANLIPGPNSTELAIHIGFERRRWAGLLVAGLCFIVPAMLATLAVAWAYVTYGALPAVGGLLYGIKPVVVAVVVQAIAGLAPRAARTWPLRALGAVALAASLLGVDELLVLVGAGAFAALAARPQRPSAAVLLLPLPPVMGAASAAITLPGIFGVFVKIGALLFGSGYVLLAFLRADLVQRLGWLTEAQLFDSIAAGQITPGPVFTTATFVGYLLAGPQGALVATAGIFLPAFVFVALSGPLVPKLRASKVAGAFLDGVNVASLALMAAVSLQLVRTALVDLPSVGLCIVAAALLLRFKPNPTWLIGLGALVGWALHGR